MVMYFNPDKDRPLGIVLEGKKLHSKTMKSLEQLRRHDPDVKVSPTPTQYLFVSNSSVLCGVSLEELEQIFFPFDPHCQFIVFPNKRAYSFIEFCSLDSAERALRELNGKVPPQLKKSHLPFIIAYLENLPESKDIGCSVGPRDLRILENFISETEEDELVRAIESDSRLSTMKHRSVLHYGFAFDYASNSAFVPSEMIPRQVERIVDRLLEDGVISERPDQVTANVYEAGQGIPSHFDTHSAFQEHVLSLSMLSDVVMEFKDAANACRIAGILLRRRSLCILQGDARYRWKHGIVNRQHDICPNTNRVLARQKRISLTLRKIRREPCVCAYREFCDWDRNGEMAVGEEPEKARQLEENYVSDVYERIAAHFDETRHSHWKAVQGFLDSLPRGSLLYDVGCGNGKYLQADDGLLKIGCDRCSGLCSIAASKGCSVVLGDGLSLPLRASVADAVICIAVLHHMASWQRRRRLLQQIVNLLAEGGRACITVWALDQGDSQYAAMRANKHTDSADQSQQSQRLKVHDGQQFEQQDLLVPWTQSMKNGKEETHLRFYHVFEEGEMERLVAEVEGCVLDECIYEQGNWIAFITKRS